MTQNQLVSFAILTVNDSKDTDYFDYFIPFIIEAMKIMGTDTISANELKHKVNECYQIDIPINVISIILKNRLPKQGYIKKEGKKFIPNYTKIEESNFESTRRTMLGRHNKLIKDIIEFAKNRYEKDLDTNDTEQALENFLYKYQVVLLQTSIDKSESQFNGEGEESEFEFIISQFINNSIDSYSVSFDYIIDIVKGTMLSQALYYKEDINKVNMKFKGTEVYFDSTFLIYALGLAGEAREEPCLELIKMLRAVGAVTKVFRHNIDEIVGILEWCKNNLTTSEPDPHGTINHFLDLNYNPSDIERIIYSIEDEIKEKLRINVSEHVSFDEHEYVISHKELESLLSSNMNYRNHIAKERDIKSVSSIMRLRRGEESIFVENCRALFVTNNFTLSQNIKTYFYNEDNSRIIPPVLHDSALTSLLWLKNPSIQPDLPKKVLIAEAFAATQPPEHLWKRYIETVKIYENSGDISDDDIVRLRYSQGAREFLMEKTLGNEDVITIGTVRDILEEIKNKEQQKIREISNKKDEQIDQLKNELDSAKSEASATLDTSRMKMKKEAEKYANRYVNTLFFLVAICIGLLLYFEPYIINSEIHIALKIFIILIVISMSILNLFNINLIPYKNKIQFLLKRKIYEHLEKKYM